MFYQLTQIIVLKQRGCNRCSYTQSSWQSGPHCPVQLLVELLYEIGQPEVLRAIERDYDEEFVSDAW